MHRWTTVATLATALVIGCSRSIEPGVDNDDTGNPTDTNSGDTSDTNTGHTGQPSGEQYGVDCEEDYGTPDPVGGEFSDFCHTDRLTCGTYSIFASTEGGSQHYDRDHYIEYACMTGAQELGRNFEGPERVYPMTIQPGTTVTFTLYGPCEEMRLMIMGTRANDCLDLGNTMAYCYMRTAYNVVQELDFNVPPTGNPTEIEVIVETRGADPSNFRLDVDCQQ